MIILSLVIWAIVHRVRAGAIEKTIQNPLMIAQTVGLFAVLSTLGIWLGNKPRPRLLIALSAGLLSAIIIHLSMLLLGILLGAIVDVFQWIARLDRSLLRASFAVLLVTTIGCLLFIFRLRRRALYGATEALVGIVVAIQRVSTLPRDASALDTEVFLALLTASIYLVVRGLDNVHQGLTKDPIDPVATRVVQWLRDQSEKR